MLCFPTIPLAVGNTLMNDDEHARVKGFLLNENAPHMSVLIECLLCGFKMLDTYQES